MYNVHLLTLNNEYSVVKSSLTATAKPNNFTPPIPLSDKTINNFPCSNAISKVKQKNNIHEKIVIYTDDQLSFYFRRLNVILFLITRRLNSLHHPQLVRMFHNIIKHC